MLWVALAAVPVGWSVGMVIDAVSSTLPPIPWILPLLIVFLARYDRLLDALRIARLLALGKAAAVFGAVVVGAYMGLAVLALGSLEVPVGRNRAVLSALVVVAGVVVVVAALRLERACLVPPPEEDDPGSGSGARPA